MILPFPVKPDFSLLWVTDISVLIKICPASLSRSSPYFGHLNTEHALSVQQWLNMVRTKAAINLLNDGGDSGLVLGVKRQFPAIRVWNNRTVRSFLGAISETLAFPRWYQSCRSRLCCTLLGLPYKASIKTSRLKAIRISSSKHVFWTCKRTV